MKIVCISDTHGFHEDLELPKGDTIIHSGDFSHSVDSAIAFIVWFRDLDYKNKILIAGNHDRYFERLGHEGVLDFLSETDIHYLQDTSVVVDGIKFHGAPWSVQFFDWAFMKEDYELQEHWDMIDDDVDILITHTPAFGILDEVPQGKHIKSVGSGTLNSRVQELKNLQCHISGHIHECHGVKELEYTSINASSVIFDYRGVVIREPIVYDVKER